MTVIDSDWIFPIQDQILDEEGRKNVRDQTKWDDMSRSADYMQIVTNERMPNVQLFPFLRGNGDGCGGGERWNIRVCNHVKLIFFMFLSAYVFYFVVQTQHMMERSLEELSILQSSIENVTEFFPKEVIERQKANDEHLKREVLLIVFSSMKSLDGQCREEAHKINENAILHELPEKIKSVLKDTRKKVLHVLEQKKLTNVLNDFRDFMVVKAFPKALVWLTSAKNIVLQHLHNLKVKMEEKVLSNRPLHDAIYKFLTHSKKLIVNKIDELRTKPNQEIPCCANSTSDLCISKM
jgi:hypothetical protein